ncbi:MAG: alpha/beta fold hydrolase [Cyanobacteria bacterium J06555_13]
MSVAFNSGPSSASSSVSSSGRRPVVLVHGIWNTAGIFTFLQQYLESAGWPVYALSMTPNNGDAPIEVLAQQVADFVETSLGPVTSFDLVGFSMGGLTSRYYLQRLGGLGRVGTFVAVCAPHRGTALAFGSDRPGVCQMRPNSAFLADLNRDIHRLNEIRVFSFWTLLDTLILPPWSGRLPLGDAQRLNVSSHNRMIQDERGLRAIAQALSTQN